MTELDLPAIIEAETEDELKAVADSLGLTLQRVMEIRTEAHKGGDALAAPHAWTRQEDRALRNAPSADAARKIARKVGVPEHRAITRRHILRSESGKVRSRHVWTEAENRTVVSMPTAAAARQWARKNGLSENSANQKWFNWRATYGG